MFFGLLVALAALVVAEVFVVIQAVHAIGTLATVALLVLVPFLGVRVVKREGVVAWRRFQAAIASRELPGPPLLDGVLILLAGVCLLVPGFITDALGLLLLLPPVRNGARRVLRLMVMRRVGTSVIRYRP